MTRAGGKCSTRAFAPARNSSRMSPKRDLAICAPDLEDLVKWADIVDGALYESAEAAVAMHEPAMKLTLVIEGVQGHALVEKIIRAMQHQPLTSDRCRPAKLKPSTAACGRASSAEHRPYPQNGSCDKGVIYFDLVDYGIEGYNKFIPYYLFPDSAYTVSVSTSSFRTKVSVGSNPWVREPLRHNLATHLRAVWRRRTSEGRRHQLPDRGRCRCPPGRRGNPRRIEKLKAVHV